MNIVYLHTHDTGRAIEPYGYAVPTPNLARFGREHATLFRQAYCASPTCSPSRAALLCGTMPHTNGMLGLAHRGFSLHRPETHLAAYLAQNGFETALCGVQHEDENPHSLGYQRLVGEHYNMGPPSRDWKALDLGNARAAAEYINGPREKPFFLSVGLYNTHRAFPDVPPEVDTGYIQPPSTMRDSPDNRADFAAYLESAKIMDEAAGIVLDALYAGPRGQDTVVLFTTDHGLAIPDHKCTLYTGGLGVALMLAYPGNPMQGQVCDALVSQLDIYPTLCGLAGLEVPGWVQGVSLLPLLGGEALAVREYIPGEINYHIAYEPTRCVRSLRYSYIRRYSSYNKVVGCNVDECPEKTHRGLTGWFDLPRSQEELYDLYLDPTERVNVAGRPEYIPALEAMRISLEAELRRTEDPILQGVVLPPKGAKVNPPQTRLPYGDDYITDFSQIE